MKKTILAATFLLLLSSGIQQVMARQEAAPRVVNIINFIRGVEPRDGGVITPEILYTTVEKQAKKLRTCDLTGTYLLMYNALIMPQYQKLMKEEIARGCEVGGWWEVSQPQAEAANVKWRADVPWLHYADVGFSIGYTQEERMRLVDAYMAKFKEIFGQYPHSVGSWFIDAYTLGYMYDKYGIESSCNCRDQVGTDGYTMWGGYWTGGYYPSHQNAYMPAQDKGSQISVPVFRMLGSDPIYQYDAGLGINAWQSVRTLEPTCTDGGGDAKWVNWYFGTFTQDPALGFTYTQMGQENSFTWARFGSAFNMQADHLKMLKEKGTIRLENLGETGRWFKAQYKVTPATAQSALSDYTDNNNRTVWFNSRYYRVNIVWEGDRMKVRDIHIFNQDYASKYLTNPCTTHAFQYITLPLVDGNLWSSSNLLASMRLYDTRTGAEVNGGQPKLTDKGKSMIIQWGQYTLLLTEDKLTVNGPQNPNWCLELHTDAQAELPFTSLSDNKIQAAQDGFPYSATVTRGTLIDLRSQGNGKVFRISPKGNRIQLRMK